MINRLVTENLKLIVGNLLIEPTYQEGVSFSYRYNNLYKYREAIQVLEDFNLFQEAIAIVKKTKLFNSTIMYDYVSTTTEEEKHIDGVTSSLYYRVIGVIEASKDYDLKDTSTALIAKYHEMKDFSELEKFSKDLKLCIQTPLQVLVKEKQELEILSIEEGSIVLTISFGTGGIFIITKIVDLAFRYKMKWEEAKRYEEYNKSLAIENTLKEAVVKAISDQVKTYLQVESEILVKEIVTENDNEKVEIVKNSITTLNALLNNGLIIKPSLNAPPDIKNKFEEFKLLESKDQKKLNISND